MSGPGLLNAVWLTPSSSTIFSFQLLTVSLSLALGGFWGAEPPVLVFSYLGFSEPGIQCISVYCVDESRVDQMAFDKPALNPLKNHAAMMTTVLLDNSSLAVFLCNVK